MVRFSRRASRAKSLDALQVNSGKVIELSNYFFEGAEEATDAFCRSFSPDEK